MDAFYASVEQRDDQSLRGKPVLVGGRSKRAVVCAASYEARAFGCKSAMPMSRALRQCPQAVVLSPDFARYKAASQAIHRIFRDYTDVIEPLALDEAYLDVTTNKRDLPSATAVAQEIRARIADEVHLNASAGIAPCKFVAKIASDVNKPNGMCVVRPQQVVDFLTDLPLRAVPGIGPASQERLKRFGLRTVGDIRALNDDQRVEIFGRHAEHFRALAMGIDERPVQANRKRKSVGVEHTYEDDVQDEAEARERVGKLIDECWQRLQRCGRSGRTVTLKIKSAEFKVRSRSRSIADPIRDVEHLAALVDDCFVDAWDDSAVRLLGVSVSALADPAGGEQQHLSLLSPTANDAAQS